MPAPRKAVAWRSGLEGKIGDQLSQLGVPYAYEAERLDYIVPESRHRYTPDFKLLDSGIYVESKGLFSLEDRKKHLLLKSQFPGLDLRFVFSRSKSPIRKGSKTTYADWCEEHGFRFADKLIPVDWLSA
jgi:hypothetical protein